MSSAYARRGSVLMEFVVSMPVLVTLVFLVLQFAQIWTVRQLVSYSAFCATRSLLSAGPHEWAAGKAKASRCDHAAASRVLAWVNEFGRGGGAKSVPGWGEIPESAGVDNRLEVESSFVPGQYASSKVVYRFPLLVPVAGQMISFLARHSADESRYMEIGSPSLMWSGEEELFDGVPYIELTETCVLPLPFDPTAQPGMAYTYTSQ